MSRAAISSKRWSVRGGSKRRSGMVLAMVGLFWWRGMEGKGVPVQHHGQDAMPAWEPAMYHPLKWAERGGEGLPPTDFNGGSHGESNGGAAPWKVKGRRSTAPPAPVPMEAIMKTRHSLPLLLALALAAGACDSPHTLQSDGGEPVLSKAATPVLGPPGSTGATSEVYRFADMEVAEGARAELLRTPDALRMRTHTTELDPGHVMTLWWIIFNHPEHFEHGAGGMLCGEGDLFDGPDGPTGVEPACVYADGSMVGGNRGARFQDRIVTDEGPRDSCIDFFGDLVPDLFAGGG